MVLSYRRQAASEIAEILIFGPVAPLLLWADWGLSRAYGAQPTVLRWAAMLRNRPPDGPPVPPARATSSRPSRRQP